MKEICRAQKLQFEMMKMSSFNSFDGTEVVSLLESNPEIWIGCWMQRDDLITLRDIKDNHFNIDSLYILTDVEHHEALYNLVEAEFCADEIGFLTDNEASSLHGKHPINNEMVLSIWWD